MRWLRVRAGDGHRHDRSAAHLSGVWRRRVSHTWRWRKYLPERFGQPCRIVAVGRMNSALIEFADGYRVITSRYAVRKGLDVA
jgi:hypothetical protein